MIDESQNVGRYQIEVSGWGLDSAFFVERADMIWTQGTGDRFDKRLLLHRSLAEGSVVFVRLLMSESASNSVPIPYRVESMRSMDCSGRCEVVVVQLHPQLNAPNGPQLASKSTESSISGLETKRSEPLAELEEVLHEA